MNEDDISNKHDEYVKLGLEIIRQGSLIHAAIAAATMVEEKDMIRKQFDTLIPLHNQLHILNEELNKMIESEYLDDDDDDDGLTLEEIDEIYGTNFTDPDREVGDDIPGDRD